MNEEATVSQLQYFPLTSILPHASLVLPGVTEAFVHAVLDSRGIQQTNLLLVAFSALHLMASIFLINSFGAVGLVLADSINMLLRVTCSMW